MVSKVLFILVSLIIISCSCSPIEKEKDDCSIKNNCGANQQCLNKQCVALECSPEGINDVCGNGNICYNGKCITPSCSPERDRAICGEGSICLYGKCQKDPYYCSEDAPYGLCPVGKKCYNGECKDFIKCSINTPNGECVDTWKECIEGECKAKESMRIYPKAEDVLNLKVNQPLDSNKFYLLMHLLPKRGYEIYSDKRMFGAYDYKAKKLTHVFTYKKGITGRPVKNPKTGKYYYFDWWPESFNDVDFVELDPKVGKLIKKRGFDNTPYDSQMWYISPSGKALIDLSSGCEDSNGNLGYLTLVYDIENDIEKRWCLAKDVSYFFYLENGDLYSLNFLGASSADKYNYGVIIYRLDIDRLNYYEIYRTWNFDKGNRPQFSEDGLMFYTEFDHKNQRRNPVVIDIFSTKRLDIDFDFSKFLDNDKEIYYLAPYFSNGKYLFYLLYIIEDVNGSTLTKRILTLAIDIKKKKYEVVRNVELNAYNVSDGLSNDIYYIKKYNIVRHSATFSDFNTLKTYWMSYVGGHRD